jgi:hypothetical protein
MASSIFSKDFTDPFPTTSSFEQETASKTIMTIKTTLFIFSLFLIRVHPRHPWINYPTP